MLLRLGDTNQASQVGVAEVPGALNSAPVAQHQRKRGAWLGALPRNLHSGEATRLRIVPAAVIIQRASGDAILAAILRSALLNCGGILGRAGDGTEYRDTVPRCIPHL